MGKRWRQAVGVGILLLATTLTAEAAAVKAFVSIAPQKYFVQKIGGELVTVSVLVPPGADPHQFEPKPRQMAALAQSAVYFAIGVEFEKAWLKKIAAANPRLRIVRTDEGIAKLAAGGEDPREKAARPASQVHSHDAGAPDPHIWLAPPLAKRQAEKIRDGLSVADPLHRADYEARCASFLQEIDALDAELKALFAGRKGEQFMVFHPSWGYFAAAYGLRQIPIESGGKEPKAAQLQKLIRQARERRIAVIFVQPQFSAKSAELLAREIGGQVVVADPMAEDWAANLRDVGRKFGAAAR
ncbi:MAG: zinc ABC transporter substrate-binding protein [Deltaproteobacteria bacterium]|nr:zinc ABC transporter substrate-binding protein [Deltaproteobacteria bacterium]